MWFVFANVTSNCPICVQYLVRSGYVISSLRPAYARIYPTAREDLAAETFFHMQSNSVLASGITDDDLITWFGKNSTQKLRNHLDLEHYPGCEHFTNASKAGIYVRNPNTKTIANTLTTQIYLPNNTTSKNKEPNNLQNNSRLHNIPHAIKNYSMYHNSTNLKINISRNIMNASKENQFNSSTIISKKIVLLKKHNFMSNTSNNDNNLAKNVSLNQYKKEIKTSNAPVKEFKKNNYYKIVKGPTTNSRNNTSSLKNKIQNDKDARAINKHVNKEIQKIPVKYKDRVRDVSLTSTTESVFPEDKDDKFLVLDKNTLWGLLREVVHDEIDKKDKSTIESEKVKKVEVVKKLRYQGFT